MVQAKSEASTTLEQTVEGMLADAQDATVASNPQPHLKLVRKSSSEPRGHRVSWPFEEKSAPVWPPLDAPNVRREESVIAEIARARNEKLWRVGAVARRMSTQIKRSVDVLHESSRGALRRFESLPRSKQILWVAAPYVGAAFLVGLLMAIDEKETVAITAVPVPAAVEANPSPQPIIAEAAAAAVAEAPAPPTAPAPRSPMVKERHQLPVYATLYARPDDELKVARVRPQLLTVYPDFPTEEGWVLVMTEKGTVGYLERARLDGDPEPKTKKKRVRPRRRK
jgi:hypothetical protein